MAKRNFLSVGFFELTVSLKQYTTARVLTEVGERTLDKHSPRQTIVPIWSENMVS